MDLVSVIIPTYNRQKTIIRAIESAIKQTYSNIEIIIVDDCSNDNTELIVKERYGDMPQVSYNRLERNSGACAARNYGISLSQGAYIAFLDSDDEFYPDKIEKQIKKIHQSGADLCASWFNRIDSNGNVKLHKICEESLEKVYENLLYCNFVTTGTLMGKRKCFVDIHFDESLPRYQDWDLVLRLAQRYQFCFLHEPTLLQHDQLVSITSSTNHQKTYAAMQAIYSKNCVAYEKDKKADTQIKWLMGIHSMYTKEERYDYLWIGVVGNGFSFKRFIYYILSWTRITKIFTIKI